LIQPIVRASLVVVALGMSACASNGPEVAAPVEPELSLHRHEYGGEPCDKR